MDKKERQKKCLTRLGIISAIILVIGVLLGFGLTNYMIHGLQNVGDVYVDGANFASILTMFGTIGSLAIGMFCIFASIFTVGAIWIVYGIIILIQFLWHKLSHTQFFLFIGIVCICLILYHTFTFFQ